MQLLRKRKSLLKLTNPEISLEHANQSQIESNAVRNTGGETYVGQFQRAGKNVTALAKFIGCYQGESHAHSLTVVSQQCLLWLKLVTAL